MNSNILRYTGKVPPTEPGYFYKKMSTKASAGKYIRGKSPLQSTNDSSIVQPLTKKILRTVHPFELRIIIT